MDVGGHLTFSKSTYQVVLRITSLAVSIRTSHDLYRGEDAAEKFTRDLQQEAKQLFDEFIATPNLMLLTATELRSFNNAITFRICAKPQCELTVTL